MSNTAADLAQQFESVRPAGQGKWQARCPAHEDRTASLSISEGNNGKVLVYCHAGCSTEDVLAKVGKRVADLMPPNDKPQPRRLVAAYNYRDESGKLLYQAVRYEPKDFRQRVPEANGWGWKLNGVRRVLYRLPEIINADPTEPVFVFEGEKDCDRGAAMGLVTTCNVGGASKSADKSKWLADYNESLRGRRVFIVPDNDDPGLAHAEGIRRQLQGIAESAAILKLPGLPAKGDFSDWANAGGTKEQLLALAEAQLVTVTSSPAAKTKDEPAKIDPSVYSIPGFVDTLIDYTMGSAPYPNRQLAFCGALSLLSLLVARKVQGPSGLLTNLLVLGLANSGSGKDHPRTINARILSQAGMSERLSGRIASGQGLEEIVFEQPAHLFQIDEFDSTLIAINKPNDAIGSEIAARFMELYSASQSVYQMRVKVRKADEPRRCITHPHVSVFATCIPGNFYSNLTPKLLSNGLVARMLVIESGERGRGQNARLGLIPQRIIDVAEYWRDFSPGGDIAAITGASPLVVEHDDDAVAIFEAARRSAEDQYDQCQRNGDNAGCSIWARVLEQAHKLATLYACSEDHRSPYVGEEAAMWATSFAKNQATWLLSQIGERAGEESRFETIANRILLRLRNKGGRILHSDSLKASKVDKAEYQKIINTLVERGEVREEAEGKAKYLCQL